MLKCPPAAWMHASKHLQSSHQFCDVDELKQRLMKVWYSLGQSVTNAMDKWTSLHVYSCQRRAFWAFNTTGEHTYANV